jgi:hypothetical protein
MTTALLLLEYLHRNQKPILLLFFMRYIISQARDVQLLSASPVFSIEAELSRKSGNI